MVVYTIDYHDYIREGNEQYGVQDVCESLKDSLVLANSWIDCAIKEIKKDITVDPIDIEKLSKAKRTVDFSLGSILIQVGDESEMLVAHIEEHKVASEVKAYKTTY